MATVTYKNQPGIHKTRGTIPLEGTSHLYRVKKVLWPGPIENVLESLLMSPSLHICSGKSQLGDVRLDIDMEVNPTVLADAAKLPFKDLAFVSILCDPPYNGKFQWNHDMLSELSRVSSKRIIFQHWFLPANPRGQWKKKNSFELQYVYVWQPKSYFGRVQVISVFDS